MIMETVKSKFFSKPNIEYLQNSMKINIKKTMDINIKNQGEHDLYMIMKSIYTNYAYNSVNIDKEVMYLNKIVLKEVLPMIRTGILQKKKYLEDISSPLTPLKLPLNTREYLKTHITNRMT